MLEADLRAFDRNYALANGAFLGSSERGEVAEDRDLWLWCCGMRVADFNVALPKTPIRDLAACLRRAQEFFGARGFPYRITLRGEQVDEARAALEAAGFAERPRVPIMLLDPIPPAPPPAPGLEIREVEPGPDLARFGATAFPGFGLPEALAPRFLTTAFIARPDVRAYLGLVAGEPVATSVLLSTPPLAGIYWVATREGMRRRGLGAALTGAAIEAGRALGATRAVLQASELGRPVYARMGFSTVAEYVAFEREGR